MHSAEELFLFISIRRGLIREVLHAAYALTATWPRDCHYDALNGPRKASLVESGVNLLLRDLRIGQPTGIPQVQIDDNVIPRRHFLQARAHRPCRFREPLIRGMRGEDVDAFSLLHVFRRYTAVPVHRHGAKVYE